MSHSRHVAQAFASCNPGGQLGMDVQEFSVIPLWSCPPEMKPWCKPGSTVLQVSDFPLCACGFFDIILFS